MAEFHKYGTSGKFYVPLLLASTQNFASTSVITFASSDVTIVKDGSTYRDLTNTPTGVAMGSAAIFEVVTSASEMQAQKIAIQIKDETGALVQDQMIIIDTYGASSAAHAFDLNQAIENSTMAAVVSVTSDVSGKVAGAVGSVTADVTFSSTSLVRADMRQIGGSTGPFDTFEDWYDGTGVTDTGINLGQMVSLSSDVQGKVDGSVDSVANNVTISSTFGDDISTGTKAEIRTLIFEDASSQSTGGSGGSLGNKIAATNERFFNHHQQDSSTQVVMKQGSTSEVKFVMTVTNTSDLQTVQQATTA